MNAETKAKIAIAEDDPEIRQALERILNYEGYQVLVTKDGAEALEVISSQHPDMAILDVMMPFVSGLEVCQKLRDKGNRIPILMLTAREETQDRVAGLDAGADDYMAKPFELEELLARIRALLRRTVATDVEVLSVGDLTLDAQRHTVTRAGEEIELTRTEYEILQLLMFNKGIVLEREMMYDRIWGYEFGTSSRPLDVHIGYLRRKLEAGGHDRLIETVRGVGFVLKEPKL